MTPEEMTKWRTDCDLSQRQMARYVGVGLRTWENWERGCNGLTTAGAALVKMIRTMEALHPDTMASRRELARVEIREV